MGRADALHLYTDLVYQVAQRVLGMRRRSNGLPTPQRGQQVLQEGFCPTNPNPVKKPRAAPGTQMHLSSSRQQALATCITKQALSVDIVWDGPDRYADVAGNPIGHVDLSGHDWGEPVEHTPSRCGRVHERGTGGGQCLSQGWTVCGKQLLTTAEATCWPAPCPPWRTPEVLVGGSSPVAIKRLRSFGAGYSSGGISHSQENLCQRRMRFWKNVMEVLTFHLNCTLEDWYSSSLFSARLLLSTIDRRGLLRSCAGPGQKAPGGCVRSR